MKAIITQIWASPTILHVGLAVSFKSSEHIQFTSASIPLELIDPWVIDMLAGERRIPDASDTPLPGL